ncbi:MAG TPA: biopolymer transporter ExbD [Prevotella sp.]|nr:biopolymer transporter ExbD [Prevotella sp.]
MMNFRKKSHEVPGLNTSSLPDLIFSVLFFFMIVTHMRQVTLKVECRVPQGKNLTRLTKKSAVSYIYIGKPTKDLKGKYGDGTQIQLNDKFATAPEVMDYVTAEKKRMSPEDQRLMTVSVKADRDTKMGVITDVKQALRQAKALRINYSAQENGK